MQIIQKPIAAEDWCAEVTCHICQAILSIGEKDTWYDARYGFYTKVLLRCMICSGISSISAPWSVREKAKHRALLKSQAVQFFVKKWTRKFLLGLALVSISILSVILATIYYRNSLDSRVLLIANMISWIISISWFYFLIEE